jgi:hypothetical protein
MSCYRSNDPTTEALHFDSPIILEGFVFFVSFGFSKVSESEPSTLENPRESSPTNNDFWAYSAQAPIMLEGFIFVSFSKVFQLKPSSRLHNARAPIVLEGFVFVCGFLDWFSSRTLDPTKTSRQRKTFKKIIRTCSAQAPIVLEGFVFCFLGFLRWRVL